MRKLLRATWTSEKQAQPVRFGRPSRPQGFHLNLLKLQFLACAAPAFRE